MNNTQITFDEFEKAVMHKIFEEKNAVNEILREQYKGASVFKREFKGNSFFTYLLVPESAPRLQDYEEYGYGDVIASINGSDFDYGFVLFVEDGLIAYLEGTAQAESWPEVITSFELMHFNYKR